MRKKGKNSVGTNKKVTNWANWQIKWWQISQILLYMASSSYSSHVLFIHLTETHGPYHKG